MSAATLATGTDAAADPAALHADWAAALLDPHRAPPAGLRTWNGSDPAARFDVYRNNVTASLVAALADTFPVVQALVGEAFFAALARRYVRAHPPRSPLLAAYGEGLPAAIAADAAAAALPWLADLARLEHARVLAFHAADAPPLAPAELAARLADAGALPRTRWALHPSLRAIVSAHAIVDLWAAHQSEDAGQGDLAAVDPACAQSALVGREGDDVVVLAVAPAAAVFVAALGDGLLLGPAVQRAAEAEVAHGTAFDLPATLALLLARGWLIRADARETTP